jgi:hypothetical protein
MLKFRKALKKQGIDHFFIYWIIDLTKKAYNGGAKK